MTKYRWIITEPVKRRLHGLTEPLPPNPCRRCGYDPVPVAYKKCPACFMVVAR